MENLKEGVAMSASNTTQVKTHSNGHQHRDRPAEVNHYRVSVKDILVNHYRKR